MKTLFKRKKNVVTNIETGEVTKYDSINKAKRFTRDIVKSNGLDSVVVEK